MRKIETDRVIVKTFSGEGLSPIFQKRTPWIKPTKPKSTRGLKRNTVTVRLRHTALQRGYVTSKLVCVIVCKQARVKVAMRKCSYVYQLWFHSCTHCIRITGLHALHRRRNDQPPRGRCQRWTSRYGGMFGKISPR